MTADAASIDATVRALLGELAPEADLAKLDPTADFRKALDIDSFAFLQFVVGLHDRLGIDVPEADYARLRTLAGCRAYLESRPSAQPARGRNHAP
jgi:acyl carrier protein